MENKNEIEEQKIVTKFKSSKTNSIKYLLITTPLFEDGKTKKTKSGLEREKYHRIIGMKI